MSDSSDPEKTAKIDISVTDDGTYGSEWCGHCGHQLPDRSRPAHCPDCGLRFDGTQVHPGFGGSDL